MSDTLLTGLVTAACSGLVVGAIEGWRRAGLSGALKNMQDVAATHARELVGSAETRALEAAAAAEARARDAAAAAAASTLRLGTNLGPRVQDLAERLAHVEGKLGVQLQRPDPGKMEGADDARTGR
jgi:hypothetical protein